MWLSYNDLYEVSEEGQVRHKTTGGMPKGTKTKGYVILDILGKKTRRARMIASVFCPRIEDDDLQVDHINGIRHDDRACNLRWIDRSGNCINRRGENISVCLISKKISYRVQFHKKGKSIFNKYFKTLEEAIQARDLFRSSDLYMSIVGFIL